MVPEIYIVDELETKAIITFTFTLYTPFTVKLVEEYSLSEQKIKE